MAHSRNESFESLNKPHLKDKYHHDQSIDITEWNLSSSITILYHSKIYKLPRDTTKHWPDVMKNAVAMKKRYGMLFKYLAKNSHYLAFFDSIEKCRIFSTTGKMSLHQIEALTTELWNLEKEFNIIRYGNSFQIGLTLVVETKKEYYEIHGPKRYIQALSSKQAQNWFHCINEALGQNYINKIIVPDTDEFDNELKNNEDFQLEDQELE
eukprot:407444_1